MAAVTPEPQLVTTGLRIDAGGCKNLREFACRFQRAVGIEQVGIMNIARAGHVAAAHARARFRLLAAKRAGERASATARLLRRRAQHSALSRTIID